MNILKLLLLLSAMFLLNACGGSGGGESKSENINFYENADRSIDIVWQKDEQSYKALAIQDANNHIKIFDSSSSAAYKVVCKPLNPNDSTVTYSYTVYQNNNPIQTGDFNLVKSKGYYKFAIGSGSSFEKAKFVSLDEQISSNGLDINIRYGQYKLLDRHRTFDQYHGYFILLKDNQAKGIEYLDAIGWTDEYGLVWKYDRKEKIFILDARPNGGYATGRVYGNGNEFNVQGQWSNGSNLDSKFIYLDESTKFTHIEDSNNKVISSSIVNASTIFAY